MQDWIGPLFPLSFFVLLAAERFVRGGAMPPSRRWIFKGVFFFLIAMAINVALPAFVTPLLVPWAPFDLTGLGLAGGTVVTILAASFVDYWLHRTMHRSTVLWRYAHQLHHSAERVDMAGFGFVSPIELVLSVLLSTLVGTFLGASADAVVLAGYLYYVIALVQHLNVNTPAWLGWFVQRPEAHRVHHTRGVHAYNYGLPLWDALLRTRRNPTTWNETYGFWDGASSELVPMLLGRDVSAASEVQGSA
jgi:sterol desaturase/sphingolipid hydroxylase (fatty acid hydroxylase superfamily)